MPPPLPLRQWHLFLPLRGAALTPPARSTASARLGDGHQRVFGAFLRTRDLYFSAHYIKRSSAKRGRCGFALARHGAPVQPSWEMDKMKLVARAPRRRKVCSLLVDFLMRKFSAYKQAHSVAEVAGTAPAHEPSCPVAQNSHNPYSEYLGDRSWHWQCCCCALAGGRLNTAPFVQCTVFHRRGETNRLPLQHMGQSWICVSLRS